MCLSVRPDYLWTHINRFYGVLRKFLNNRCIQPADTPSLSLCVCVLKTETVCLGFLSDPSPPGKTLPADSYQRAENRRFR